MTAYAAFVLQHIKDLVDFVDVPVDAAALCLDAAFLLEVVDDVLCRNRMLFVGLLHEVVKDNVGFQLLVVALAAAWCAHVLTPFRVYSTIFFVKNKRVNATNPPKVFHPIEMILGKPLGDFEYAFSSTICD